ncbi:MAG: DNA-3-methyladenine glycosylase 2 family protein [Candidatus Protistobacter heckmanni]|nr:DNA-3-methyladenine glycosylase 2 family protein [Candidatus Protistobacter heckmanni]
MVVEKTTTRKASAARPAAKKPAVKKAPAAKPAPAKTAGKTVKGASKPVAKAPAKSAPKAVPKTASPASASAAAASRAAVPRPDYWDQACMELMNRDRILRKVIPLYGPVHLVSRGDPFTTLARASVGQQISVKAAQAVWDRLAAACPKFSPGQLLKLSADRIASCGLSRRKTEYLTDLASHFESGAASPKRWLSMDDEEIIKEMTQIRGIGRWSAQMYLIFNMLRPNVLPLDDLGLIKAISVNYFSGEPVTRSEAREVAANWEPWSTVATWYLWRSLDPIPVDY